MKTFLHLEFELSQLDSLGFDTLSEALAFFVYKLGIQDQQTCIQFGRVSIRLDVTDSNAETLKREFQRTWDERTEFYLFYCKQQDTVSNKVL